jgi:hypothetical protein
LGFFGLCLLDFRLGFLGWGFGFLVFGEQRRSQEHGQRQPHHDFGPAIHHFPLRKSAARPRVPSQVRRRED